MTYFLFGTYRFCLLTWRQIPVLTWQQTQPILWHTWRCLDSLYVYPLFFPPLVLHGFCISASRQYTPVLNSWPLICVLMSSGWLHSITLTHTYSIISSGNINFLYTRFSFMPIFSWTQKKEYMKGLVYPIYCLHSHIGYGIDMICHLVTVLTVVKLTNTLIISVCFYMCYVLVLHLYYVYI
jgi:hypothetical protein